MVAGKLVKYVPRKGLTEFQKKQASRIAKRAVNRQLEEKYEDFVDTGTAVNTTARIIDITNIAEGSGSDQRDGDKISLTRIKGQLMMLNNSAANDVTRAIIFQWKGDTSITVPGVADVLHDTTNVPYLSRTLLEHRLINVLWDRTLVTGATASNEESLQVVRFNLYKGFNKTLTFQIGGTAGKNKLYLMLLGNNVANAPNSYYHVCCYYRE